MHFRLLLPLAALLASCAWNPVLSPYAAGEAAQRPASELATVWGVREGATLRFTHVDGQSLPSRGGGGYPLSLTLTPGEHSLRVFFSGADHRWTELTVKAQVEAGHSYVVEYLYLPAGHGVVLQLVDLGTDQQCQYQITDSLRGSARLGCGPKPAG